ncbi:amidohydrolase family protein [Candidatus Bathyarchaeota archaeon]|nr:amidohydrolase family protein [Candidatus Bathyarchaeota archaeon]
MSIVIKGGLLIDGISPKPLEDPVIVIKDGRIAFLGTCKSPEASSLLAKNLDQRKEARQAMTKERAREKNNAEAETDASAEEVIDATGMTILPGLVDPHVHLCLSAGKDCLEDFWSDTEDLHGGNDVLLLRAAQNAQRCLASGITTVADCGSRGSVALTVRNCINEGLIPGPRVLSCGMPITSTSGHMWYMGLEVEGKREIRKTVRNLVKLGVDFIKMVSSGGFTDPFDTNPLELQFSREEQRILVEDAHRLGKPVASHAYPAIAIKASIDAGVDRIEHCHWAIEKGKYQIDTEYVHSMVQRGIWAGFTLGNSKGLLPIILGEASLREDDYFAVFRRMKEAGVRIAIHSDAGCSRVKFEDFAISIAGAAATLKMEPMEALSAATLGNARCLGIDGLVGSIEVGKAGDILILEANPLEDLLNLRRVWKVLKDGKVVVEKGAVLP